MGWQLAIRKALTPLILTLFIYIFSNLQTVSHKPLKVAGPQTAVYITFIVKLLTCLWV